MYLIYRIDFKLPPTHHVGESFTLSLTFQLAFPCPAPVCPPFLDLSRSTHQSTQPISGAHVIINRSSSAVVQQLQHDSIDGATNPFAINYQH